MTTPIEDYAVLGDTATCALVGRDGSIDWLCLPRFDSAACFAALLGTPEHGRWLLGPSGSARTTRGYVGDSAVLETVHQTDTGAVKVTDFMPLADGRSDIVRRVEGLRGTVRMRHEWVVRFSYGKVRPWVHRTPDAEGQEVISAVAGPDMLVLRGERLPLSTGHRHVDEFDVTQGETVTYSATWFPSWQRIPAALDAGTRLSETIAQTSAWVERSCYQGPYRDLVVRSLLVLRMLTHSVTGGIVAAPTSSLPEEIGGETELGLPVLLATGCLDDRGSAPGSRLHRGDAAVAQLAVARRGRRPGTPADHVCRGRRAGSARTGAGPPARVCRLRPGAGGQRGGRPEADRRAR